MIEPETITKARRILGRQLASCRKAAGLSQEQLAPLVHYGRSTVANAEIGRQSVSKAFWDRVDSVVKADGALVRAYQDLNALIRQARQETAEALEADHGAMRRQLQGRGMTCSTRTSFRSTATRGSSS